MFLRTLMAFCLIVLTWGAAAEAQIMLGTGGAVSAVCLVATACFSSSCTRSTSALAAASWSRRTFTFFVNALLLNRAMLRIFHMGTACTSTLNVQGSGL